MPANVLDPKNLTGPQKAAILLLSMGEKFTTAFFKNLDEESIKRIGKHMSRLTDIPSNVLKAVMSEFEKDLKGDENLYVSGRKFLEDVMRESLDADKAEEVYKAIGDESSNIPFSDLAYITAPNLVHVIKGEHPQTIALILSHLPQENAAEILILLPEEIKVDVALRIINIGQVQDELVRELDQSIKKDLSRIGIATRKFDGVETLANILNVVDGKTEDYVLSNIEKEDTDLAEIIRQKMFVFEDLLQVDDRSFREILHNVETQLLAKSLKTASEALTEKIFSSLSERAADMLREDMEILGPVRLMEVEEAQQAILRTARRLEEEGKIVISGKGGEEVFV